MMETENIKPIDINLDIESSDFDLEQEIVNLSSLKFREIRYKNRELFEKIISFFNDRPLIGYSFRRIFYGLVTLLVAIIILFLIVRSVTDDLQYLPLNWQNMKLSEDQLQELLTNRMRMFGVDGPIIKQLFNYLRNLFPFIPKDIVVDQIYKMAADGITPEFDPVTKKLIVLSEIVSRHWVYLGVTSSPSIADEGTEVMLLFNKAIPYSFAFGSISVLISYLIGVPLGIQSAKKKGKYSDGIINGISVGLIAIPSVVIVVGIYLISVAGFGNSGLYSSGKFATKFWPVMAIVFMITPTKIVLTRRYVIDEMTSDYARFALAKGITNTKVYYVHIFRNAGIRVIKQFPLDLAFTLFGASILAEQQWGIPGMGRYIVSAVSGNKDSFIILGYVSFAAFITVFSTLISDLIMVWLDPRVKLTK